jgi:mannose-6-phosphate isomerase-like protein (cupin superfamily)
MYIVLNADQQGDPAAYPQWCNLSCFRTTQAATADVEPHYHDAAEIWLWHRGRAEGEVDGKAVALCPGVMVYTPAGSLHAYRAGAEHANTGIIPRREPWMRQGRLHPEETGETPSPEIPPFHVPAEQNTAAAPAVFPAGAFLKSAYAARVQKGGSVLRSSLQSWTAILVREGRLAGNVGGEMVAVAEPDLLVLDCGAAVDFRAESASELAFAVGWPSGADQ